MPTAAFLGARDAILLYPGSVVIRQVSFSGRAREKHYPLHDVGRFLRSFDKGESVAVAPRDSRFVVLDVPANPWAVTASRGDNPQFWDAVAQLSPRIPVETVTSPAAVITELCRGVHDPVRLAELPFEVGFTKLPDFSASRLLHNDYDALAFDNDRKKVAMFNKEYLAGRVYEAAEIMSVEVYEDGRSISQASRPRQIGAALVGNLVAGGVGAVVGGLGAKARSRDEIHSLALRLTLDDSDFPTFDLPLNRSVVLKGAANHSYLSLQARRWASLLEGAIRDSEPSSTALAEPVPPAGTSLSLADELGKLSALYASGVLTEDEFAKLKSRLIS